MKKFETNWRCPKCGSFAYHASYIAHDDTLTVACDMCGYWENRLPRDRDHDVA